MDGYWHDRHQEEAAKHEADMMRADEHVYKLEDENDALRGEVTAYAAHIQDLDDEINELRHAARAVLDAYAGGADLNTLYDVIQTELAPLVEHEEADDVS